ncbi:replication initiation protein [Pedobacter sp.]|uniref:replication initiation protein n=1 Tax=Pedobacter sp. TaxID=1411316 RepID=UPI003D7F3F12
MKKEEVDDFPVFSITNSTDLNIVKTDQSFVHIKHNITIRQYKFWHLIIKSFGEQLENGIEPDSNGFFYQSIKEISDFIGYEVVRSELKNDLEGLRVAPIVVNYLEKDGLPAEHFMGFISEYKVLSKRVGFRLPSVIENIVRNKQQNQQMFLLLNWNIFNSFSGKYEAIIYKLCRDYIGIGRTPNFTLEKYREYMGIEETEYKEFKELNRWVIKKPVAELNKSELCDIEIDVEFEKKGRSVVGLHFKVKYARQNLLNLPLTLDDSAFKDTLINIPVPDQRKYLDQFESKEIYESIARANAYINDLKSKGKEAKIGAIYHKAISERWGLTQLEEGILKQRENEEKLKKQNQEKQKQKDQELEEAQRKEQDEKLLFEFLAMDDETKHHFIVKMLDNLKKIKVIHASMWDLYNEYGFDAHNHSGAFKGNLIAAIKEHMNLMEEIQR